MITTTRPIATHSHTCPHCGKIYRRAFVRCVHADGDRLPCFDCAQKGKGIKAR